MIYSHVLNQGGKGVKSLADYLYTKNGNRLGCFQKQPNLNIIRKNLYLNN